MINVLLCSYNNYYNRIVKKLDTVTEYRAATAPLFIDLENINFNPADGVTTDLIVGKGTGAFLSWETQGPNYCIVYDKTNDVETIKSRWFIMDEDRTRNGQYKISLKRDVLADNIENLETSPIYVEKGIISDINSPLLCNNEGLTVNQIKQDEILLKDKTECPWLVMYLKKGVLGNSSVGDSGKITLDIPNDNVNVYEELQTPIESWGYYQYTTTDYNVVNSNSIILYYKNTPNSSSGQRYTLKSSGYREFVPRSNIESNLYDVDATVTTLDNNFKPNFNLLTNLIKTGLGYGSLQDIMRYNDKIIKDSNGKYFRATIEANGNEKTSEVFITSDNASVAKSYLNTVWNNANGSSQSANDKAFKSNIKYTPYRIVLEELTDLATVVDFSEYTGTGTVDSPLFDAICLPYGDMEFSNPGELLHHPGVTKDLSIKIMNSIASQLSSSYVLDLQLLPYCPLDSYQYITGRMIILDVPNMAIVGKNGNLINAVLPVCPSVTSTFDITKEIKIEDDSEVSDTFKLKYLNDCTMVRLCSPNYNGVFEMNLAKNGGKISSFNVDMTLRPFNPYIHVNPYFNFLYGQDFNDIRGLVCGGDFSLGIINDAWAQYEIQNKNYQAIFDRQIQNLDVNNAINRQEAIFQAVAGTAQGATTGATAGFMASGSPWGALAGGIVGGGTALGGGIADISNLGKRQAEARDYAIDRFNLELGNVRALPYSITKTSCLTANNKLFPFVEIYECKPEEKEAYYLKLEYDGMTVGKIDNLVNFKSDSGLSFFKGQLIRNTALSVDNHILNEINNELMKGVYI